MVMTFVPRAVASLANFERIQDYLLVFPCQDDRLNLKLYETEPSGLPDYNLEQSVHPPAVVVNDVTVQYSPDVEAILRNINLHITSGSVMMCSGAVGSGKTTLAKLILGEVSPSRGSVYVSTRCMGLCAQAPWLPSGTIREIICGPNGDLNLDSSWYDTVLHACDLLPDLKALPENDQTQVGSRGLNLSGGQRQRVVRSLPVHNSMISNTDTGVSPGNLYKM
jgi:ATP-binding cassette subfamily C (CFTR/MRP) protein 1